MRLFMGCTHMMDSCVYHTLEKKIDFHSARYEPCWSRWVCDSQASHVSALWIHPIISRPLLQSLELLLTLIFGPTSSDLLHHRKVAWQSGLWAKPGCRLWAGLSCLGWAQWDGPWLSRPLVLLAMASPSAPHPLGKAGAHHVLTLKQRLILLSLNFPFTK